jgi:hypothetical protein
LVLETLGGGFVRAFRRIEDIQQAGFLEEFPHALKCLTPKWSYGASCDVFTNTVGQTVNKGELGFQESENMP